ncbi:MAG: hypothetical protein V4615_08080 [Bacteroidota bacterium]
MKNMIKRIIPSLLLVSALYNASAQNAEAGITSDVPRIVTKAEAPAIAAAGKEMVIDFKNRAERPVAIFAGPKENIRNPKIETYGGLSNFQKFYLKENDVVCLMAPDKTPKACTVIKSGMTLVEVNSSANGISAK